MVAEVDSPEILSEQNQFALSSDQNEKKVADGQFTEEQILAKPHHQLTTIEAILNDQIHQIEKSEEKLKAIQATLAEEALPNQQKVEMRLHTDSENKVAQITDIIEDQSKHVHDQFASIQAILGNHHNCNNPWVQAHQALNQIEDSSKNLIKSEEKRQKEMREIWKKEMEEKAKHHHNTAWKQEKWNYGSMAATMAAAVLPSVNELAGAYADEIKKMPLFIQEGSKLSELYSKNSETILDWSTQQARQDLEQQGQTVQEGRQNDTSLKERHLEVIKTLAAQIAGH